MKFYRVDIDCHDGSAQVHVPVSDELDNAVHPLLLELMDRLNHRGLGTTVSCFGSPGPFWYSLYGTKAITMSWIDQGRRPNPFAAEPLQSQIVWFHEVVFARISNRTIVAPPRLLSPIERIDQDAPDLALDDAQRLLRRAARWLPTEVRADELATAIDYLNERAKAPSEALALARWLGWHMVTKAVWARCQGRRGQVALGVGKGLAGSVGLVAAVKEVFGLTPDPVSLAILLVGAGALGGWSAARGRPRTRTQE